jgi:hypothetical protein
VTPTISARGSPASCPSSEAQFSTDKSAVYGVRPNPGSVAATTWTGADTRASMIGSKKTVLHMPPGATAPSIRHRTARPRGCPSPVRKHVELCESVSASPQATACCPSPHGAFTPCFVKAQRPLRARVQFRLTTLPRRALLLRGGFPESASIPPWSRSRPAPPPVGHRDPVATAALLRADGRTLRLDVTPVIVARRDSEARGRGPSSFVEDMPCSRSATRFVGGELDPRRWLSSRDAPRSGSGRPRSW